MKVVKTTLMMVMCMLMIGCGSSATPTALPLLEAPITIEGIEVSLSSAARVDTYGEHEPRSRNDEMLVIAVNCVAVEGLTEEEIALIFDGWTVTVTDESNREYGADIARTTIIRVEGVPKDVTRTWVFVVDKASESFTLHLPEGHDIQLAPALAD